jgi:hypothetical protein
MTFFVSNKNKKLEELLKPAESPLPPPRKAKTLRAVWSFWSKPYLAGQGHEWLSEFHHGLSWALSLQEAGRHYPDTWLFTDDDGARLLIDTLQLPFAHVRTDLNDLANYDPRMWNLGKLHTYRLQDEPFVHLDTDAFLWLPLPKTMTSAAVFAQNPVPLILGKSGYKPEVMARIFAGVCGWLPEEWGWYRSPLNGLHCEASGLIGGNRTEFFRYVYDHAFSVLDHPGNQAALGKVADKMRLMVLLEEYLPAACIETHRTRRDSPFYGMDRAYLFDSLADAVNPEHAVRVGYTHLVGSQKRNPAVMRLLETRILRDNPAQYEHFERFLVTPQTQSHQVKKDALTEVVEAIL